MHICMTFLNKGDKVLVPNPGYPTYSAAVRLAGGEMLQHRTLRTVLSYPLHRKLLESIQETYIAFAVSARPAPVNDRLARLLMLDRQGSPDVLDAWNTYEEELLHLILTIRSQYAGTETH